MIHALFIAFALLQAAPVVESTPAALADELRAACETFRAEHGIVGMGVAVARGDQLVFEQAFGEADREARQAAEKATLFRLASVSKPVTATIVMQLVEAQKLELDADVARYLPELEPKLPGVTLARILSHNSGVRHYRIDRFDNGTIHRTTAEALQLFVRDPLLFEPGTKHSYSTHAFTLAAAAVEHVTAKPFGESVRALAAKAGATTLDIEDAGVAKAARSALYERRKGGEVVRSEPREDLSWKYGGGGLECSAGDFARFLEALADAKLVSEASRERMWTRARLADGSEVDYGLGFALGERGQLVSHSGAQQGSSTAFSLTRDSGLVVVVLANTAGSGAPELVPRLRQLAAVER